MEQYISSDLIRGHIDAIILYSLFNGDKYAKSISEYIDTKCNNLYKINQATLYSSLKRLENLNYISSYWHDSPDGGRRKYFKIKQSGLDFAYENQNSWIYSRSVIDKLMCEGAIYDEIEDNGQPETTEIVSESSPVSAINEIEGNSNTHSESENLSNNSHDKMDELEKKQNDNINYKSILGEIVKKNENNSTEKSVKIELKPNKLDTTEKQNNVQINYTGARSIDFSDIEQSGLKNGYRIRISSKDSARPVGKILINKVFLFCSLLTFLLFSVEFLVFSITFKKIVNFPLFLAIELVLFVSIIAFGINFYKNPNKVSTKKIYKSLLTTVGIIVFNLLIVTFAVNMIIDVNLTEVNTTFYSLIFPATIYLDIFLYSVFRFYVTNSRFCTIKAN